MADKVVATFQLYGDHERPSTRYRDLVDLVSIITGAAIVAEPQLAAIASEAERRGVTLPSRFDTPDRGLWEPGYAAEAARSLLPIVRSLDEALAVVRPCLDPLLDGSATGTWDPKARRWVRCGSVPETPLGHLTMLKLPGDELVTIELVHDPIQGDVNFGTGLSHFVIKVESLDATISELAARGIGAEVPESPDGSDDFRTTWVIDPDGTGSSWSSGRLVTPTASLQPTGRSRGTYS